MINIHYNILSNLLSIEGDVGVSIPENKRVIEIDSIRTRYVNGWWGSSNIDMVLPNQFTICTGCSFLNKRNYKKILRVMETYFKNFDIDYQIRIEPARYSLKKGKKHDRD